MECSAENKCVYCGESSEFTKEHVFPEGLGGDDSRYLLKEGVCGGCNTGVFSNFESTLMRSSVIGLSRAINQPLTRKGKTTFSPQELKIIDREGRALESAYVHGFNVEYLAQIIFYGETVGTHASSKADLIKLLERANIILSADRVFLVEKVKLKSKNNYMTSIYHYNGTNFVFIERKGASKPPEKCIWLRREKSKLKHEEPNHPTLFRQKGGQIDFKTSDLSDVGRVLAKIRNTLPNILLESETAEEDTYENPLVVSTIIGWSSDCDRAIAKFGINLLAFQEGLDIARHPDLKPVKDFILKGVGDFRARFIDDENLKIRTFGKVPEGNHCLALTIGKGESGELTIIYSALFYGMTAVCFILCDGNIKTPETEISYYLVKYNENKISKHEFMQYHKEYGLLSKHSNSQFLYETLADSLRGVVY